MKKLGIIVLVLVILLVIAGLAAPSFVDPNKYKPKIISEFNAKTGYDLVIKGNIKVSALPLIKAYVQGVIISNNAKTLIEVDEITAYPKLLPLLSGKVEVSSIRVSKPKITVEKNVGGYSWTKVNAAAEPNNIASNPSKKPVADVSIGEVKIVDGEVYFDDKVKKKKYDVKEINITSGIASLQGPISFDAKLKFNDVPITAKGNIENFAQNFYDAKVAFDGDVAGSKITFNGAVSDGKLSVKSSDIGPVADLFGITAAKQYAKLPININSGVGYNKNYVNLQNLEVAIGDTTGDGSLSLDMDNKIDIKAKLKFKKINLDQILPKTAPQPATPKTDEEVLAEDSDPTANKPVSADIDATAEEIIYGGAVYKNLQVKAATENQEVTLQPFKIDLPGNGKAEIYGVLSKDTKGRVFDGHVNVSSDNLRDILKSLNVNTNDISDKGLKKFSLESDVIITIRDHMRADLGKILLKLDDTVFQGSITADMTKQLAISLSGAINRVDLNRYVNPAVAKVKTPEGEKNLSEIKPLDMSWLSNFPIRAALNLSIGSINYGDDNYGNVRVIMNAAPGVIKIDQLSASSKKIQIAAKASVTANNKQKPKIDIDANFGKINMADFIKTKTDDAKAPAALSKEGKERWSRETIDLSFLKKLDVDLNAHIASLIHGKFIFDNLILTAYIEDGKLAIENFSSGIFGGKVNAKATIIGSAVPGISLSFSGIDIDINKLATALSNNDRLQGKVSLSSTFATSGVSQLAMISNLKGNASIATNQIIVKGFDVDGFVKQVTNITNPEAVLSIARTISGDNAVTYLNNVNGAVGCENGICRTQSGGIKISTASASKGTLEGFADLVNWKMDMNAIFNLLIPGDTAKQTPALGLHIYGVIDQPKLDVNFDEIKRYLVQRGSKLLLKSGIIPDKYKALIPGQSSAPANDNAAPPVDGSQTQPETGNGKKPKLGKILGNELQNFLGGNKQ